MEWINRGYNMIQLTRFPITPVGTYSLARHFVLKPGPVFLTGLKFSMNNTRTTQKQERAAPVRKYVFRMPAYTGVQTLHRFGEVRISVPFHGKGSRDWFRVPFALALCTESRDQIRVCRATAHLQPTSLRFTYYISSTAQQRRRDGAEQETHELSP